jgi:16S rRNA (guanine1207-N2)-methyltransferase
MDHYYTSKPSSESQRKKWDVEILGQNFSFITDSGVFSKHQLDFGSEVLMRTAAQETYPEGNILDMGCGYGPVGIYLARTFSDRTIEMADVNERALALAEENARLNEVENVNIYASDLFVKVENKEFAAIISNPPIRAGKKVVHQILTDAYDHLQENGKLLIVIQKKQGAPSAKKKMEEVFGNVERINLEKGYWILASEKTE